MVKRLFYTIHVLYIHVSLLALIIVVSVISRGRTSVLMVAHVYTFWIVPGAQNSPFDNIYLIVRSFPYNLTTYCTQLVVIVNMF